jgi:hypothetical protein
METRGGHPEILSHADHIKIGVIGVNHGIGIGSISPVGNPRIASEAGQIC